jgi:hypothetical protein
VGAWWPGRLNFVRRGLIFSVAITVSPYIQKRLSVHMHRAERAR